MHAMHYMLHMHMDLKCCITLKALEFYHIYENTEFSLYWSFEACFGVG